MAGREDLFEKAMNEGHSAAWDQQWEKAIVCYQGALNEFPDNPKALSSLGLALLEMQRYEEALDTYKKNARLTPSDPLPMERVGQLYQKVGSSKDAIQSFLRAAELYIKTQETDKAIENWMNVTELDAENLTAHSYLAMVHERLNHVDQAVAEYLAVASLLQYAGKTDRAGETIERALKLNPRSQEARKAQTTLKSGQVLPRPARSKGGTGVLRAGTAKQLEAGVSLDTGKDPIEEARDLAITRLAQVLFESTEESLPSNAVKRGMQAIVQGAGDKDNQPKQTGRTKILLHLNQAIEAQTKNDEGQAVVELEKAIQVGFSEPAIFFDLGYLLSKTEQTDSTLRCLKVAVKHENYTLGSRLLLAQVQQRSGRVADSLVEYMEALKIADCSVVPADQAEEIRQKYEPLIESIAQQTDIKAMEELSGNIKELILRKNWRAGVLQARENIPRPEDGSSIVPLAEILTQSQSNQIIESIGKIRALARTGHLRSAMDEAFDSLKFAPTYLPLHTLIGDLLIQEDRTQEAIAKYTVVADAYSARGEAGQAVNLLRRIIQVAPMELDVRTRLIAQLGSRGMIDEAIGEYIDLADIYYRQADLDTARKTYATALRLAQQEGTNPAWSIKLMRRMADIDMQRLDWRQALQIYEQVRTLKPDDPTIRKNLIDLYIRLNEIPMASKELASFMDYLDSAGKKAQAIPFLEELAKEYSQFADPHRLLANEYRLARRIPEAVEQYDALRISLVNVGDMNGAIHAIEAIIALNPPDIQTYQSMLFKLKSNG